MRRFSGNVGRLAHALLPLLVAVALSGCGADGSDQARAGGVDGGAVQGAGDAGAATATARWRLSETPLLEIGTVEGEAPYQLHDVGGAARLPDGRIVVADGGSSQLRFFDAEGDFLFTQGQRGEGPGEWLTLDRVRRLGGDTLLVVDSRQRRNGLVSTSGEYLGARPWPEEPLFPSDQWLYGRFVVDSPVPPEDRGVVARALDRSPEPDSGAAAFAIATPAGHLWVTDRPQPAPEPTEWRVYDLEGRPLATVETPPRFEIHQVGPDAVLGTWRDELDVQFVRLYELTGVSAETPPAVTLAEAAAASDAPAPMLRAAPSNTLPGIAALVRNVATAQEVFHSDRGRYATSPDSLFASFPVQPPEEVRVDPVWADADGCLISFGGAALVGLPPGRITCWQGSQPSRPAAAGQADRGAAIGSAARPDPTPRPTP